MDLDEKLLCCHGSEKFATAPIPRLGIPKLTLSDGPHGVREEISADSWDPAGRDDDYSTCLPTASALAATWSTECAALAGDCLGEEARDRGKDVILGPGVNMMRNPLCGRNFEYFSEDPVLAGRLAAEMIRHIQSRGVAACVKHFALNSQELHRSGTDARCDERTLREIYLPAFEIAVKEGRVWAVMGAYNRFRGEYCCHNAFLLNHILKDEWGFDGLVVSDWDGVHDTLAAASGGMDLEMGTAKESYDDYFLADRFREAVRAGSVDEAVLDDKVRRYLRLMFRIGALGGGQRPAGSRNTARHREIARRIAGEAIVLLKNDRKVLPLDPDKLRKVLVVGANADARHASGGHSSGVKCPYEVTPLEGISAFLAGRGVEIEYLRGYPSNVAGEAIPSIWMGIADRGAGTRGWVCSLWRDRTSTGAPDAVFPVEQPVFDCERDLPDGIGIENFRGELRGTFTPPEGGEWTFFCSGLSQSYVRCVDEERNWFENCRSADDVSGSTTLTLEAGRSYDILIPLHTQMGQPLYPFRLTARRGRPTGGGEAELMAKAAAADAVIFVGGQSHIYDCEGSDRKDMKLHDGQNELISGLAEANRNLAVVLVGGSPVEMPWLEMTPAVLQMWYAGQEGGNALADILFGRINPSGRLPVTFPVSWEASPVGALDDYHADYCEYREGVLEGYRWFDANRVKPLFPFGFGLSYTEFAFSGARIDAGFDGESLACSVEIANTGRVAGAGVVQLYVGPAKTPGIVRPLRNLKGFAKVELRPGESRRVSFQLTRRDLSCFHPVRRRWVVPEGKSRIFFGSSSADLPETLEIRVADEGHN